jgi:hypothetical protein
MYTREPIAAPNSTVQSCAGPLQIGPFCYGLQRCDWEIVIFACEICTLAHAPLDLYVSYAVSDSGAGCWQLHAVEGTEVVW